MNTPEDPPSKMERMGNFFKRIFEFITCTKEIKTTHVYDIHTDSSEEVSEEGKKNKK